MDLDSVSYQSDRIMSVDKGHGMGFISWAILLIMGYTVSEKAAF